MSLEIITQGSFKNTERFLKTVSKPSIFQRLGSHAQRGVEALAANTPKDSGLTADSWGYEITQGRGGFTITWTNTNKNGGFPIAVSLQLGHGTGTGGWVEGQDYINPAMKPVFDEIVEAMWKEVTSA